MSLDNVMPPGLTVPFWRRLWIYQAERFPLAKQGVLIGVFAAAGAGYGALLRGREAWPNLGGLAVAAVVLFLAFFQLRVADEHKDFEDDRRFRPERPVPRGLVSLAELRQLALAAGIVQVLATAVLHLPLLALLLILWAWMGLMTAEFFAPAWLKARPLVYLFSHMAVMPLLGLFAVGCGLFPAGGALGAPILAYMTLSLATGLVLELARKTLNPEAEREGVETYSRLWGPTRAGMALALAAVAALFAGFWAHLGARSPALLFAPAALAALWLFICAARYSATPTPEHAGRLETSAGVWALASALCVGVFPLLWRG